MSGSPRPRGLAVVLAAMVLSLAACDASDELRLPSDSDLTGLYGDGSTVALNGNVVDVEVYQSADQLRRGGATWAKVGPFIYLFSPQTQDVFESWSGVGGVRVTTMDGRGRMVARAMLPRSALNSLTWPRAINLVARARLEGTQRPSYILDLIEYGEETADYEYSTRYVKGGSG
jgi:hypothetical protein